jgi:hypothetical protein
MLTTVKLVSYTSATIGVLFELIAVFSRIYSYEYYSVTNEPSTGLQVAYPYQSLSAPFFLLGIVFLVIGIVGFWVNYLRNERIKKDQLKPIIETKQIDEVPEKRLNKVPTRSPHEQKQTDFNPEIRKGLSAGVIASGLVLLICIIGTVYVWNYKEDVGNALFSVSLYPYRPYVSIFAVGAFISLGGLLYAIIVGSKQQNSQPQQQVINIQVGTSMSQIRCGNCGTMNDIDADYCKKCANKFR